MFSPGQHAPPPYPGQGQLGQPSHLQPTTPMFVAPPPKTQRVLHSEAYLKYIEGLNSDSSTVSKWDQALKGGFFVFPSILRVLKLYLCLSIDYIDIFGIDMYNPLSKKCSVHPC